MSTLDELRRANIQAQKASVTTPAEVVKKPEPEPPAAKPAPVEEVKAAAPPPAETAVSAAAPITAPEPVKQHASDSNGYQAVAEPDPEPVYTNGIASVPEIVVTEEIELVSVVYSAPDPAEMAEIADAKKMTEFMERMRAGIAKKAVHASGVKVTVDMAPELFWRLKRYSRDHGNPSLRQICLEVVIAFLDEEGY